MASVLPGFGSTPLSAVTGDPCPGSCATGGDPGMSFVETVGGGRRACLRIACHARDRELSRLVDNRAKAASTSSRLGHRTKVRARRNPRQRSSPGWHEESKSLVHLCPDRRSALSECPGARFESPNDCCLLLSCQTRVRRRNVSPPCPSHPGLLAPTKDPSGGKLMGSWLAKPGHGHVCTRVPVAGIAYPAPAQGLRTGC